MHSLVLSLTHTCCGREAPNTETIVSNKKLTRVRVFAYGRLGFPASGTRVKNDWSNNRAFTDWFPGFGFFVRIFSATTPLHKQEQLEWRFRFRFEQAEYSKKHHHFHSHFLTGKQSRNRATRQTQNCHFTLFPSTAWPLHRSLPLSLPKPIFEEATHPCAQLICIQRTPHHALHPRLHPLPPFISRNPSP